VACGLSRGRFLETPVKKIGHRNSRTSASVYPPDTLGALRLQRRSTVPPGLGALFRLQSSSTSPEDTLLKKKSQARGTSSSKKQNLVGVLLLRKTHTLDDFFFKAGRRFHRHLLFGDDPKGFALNGSQSGTPLTVESYKRAGFVFRDRIRKAVHVPCLEKFPMICVTDAP